MYKLLQNKLMYLMFNHPFQCLKDVRLVGGSSPIEGIVQFTEDGDTWETMCPTNFCETEAAVVCRHLEYSGVDRVISGIHSYQTGNVSPTIQVICDGGNLCEESVWFWRPT